MKNPDEDLDSFSRDQLIREIVKLRNGIRKHRDCSGQELCWHHPELWSLVSETSEKEITVPEWPQFLRGCVKYRESLDVQKPGAHRNRQEFES